MQWVMSHRQWRTKNCRSRRCIALKASWFMSHMNASYHIYNASSHICNESCHIGNDAQRTGDRADALLSKHHDSCHIWMRHITYTMSHITYIMSQVTYAMMYNELAIAPMHCSLSMMIHVTCEWFMSRINESGHICMTYHELATTNWWSCRCIALWASWVMSQWMRHVTYECVMSHMNESHMNESCHIWMRHVT